MSAVYQDLKRMACLFNWSLIRYSLGFHIMACDKERIHFLSHMTYHKYYIIKNFSYHNIDQGHKKFSLLEATRTHSYGVKLFLWSSNISRKNMCPPVSNDCTMLIDFNGQGLLS